MPDTRYPMPDARFPTCDIRRYRLSVIGYLLSAGIGYRVSGIGYRVSGIGHPIIFLVAPGPGGRKPANSVRTPKVAAACGVLRCSVRPGVLSLPNVARPRPEISSQNLRRRCGAVPCV